MYNIFKKYDQFIESVQSKTFTPMSNTQLNTPNKDTIFKINNMDNFMDIRKAKFYMNGRYLQKDGKEYPKDSKIQLINDFPKHLWTKVQVKIHGKTITEIEYVGKVSTINGVIGCNSLNSNGPSINSGFVSKFKGGGNFNVMGLLSEFGLPFFNDISIPVINCDMELCFTRNTDDDALLKKDVVIENGKIIIDEFSIKIPVVRYDALQNVLLVNEINTFSKEKKYTFIFKAWQMIEERNIKGKTIKMNVTNQYLGKNKPMFCGFGLQTNKLNTQDHDPGEFDNCRVRSYSFELNGINYPAERQDEDFNNNKFCQFYDDLMSYKLTYHKNTQELPLMYIDPTDFKEYRSIFLTKTVYQPENILFNKKNIILHIELHEDLPKDTICYIFFIREDEFLFDVERGTIEEI